MKNIDEQIAKTQAQNQSAHQQEKTAHIRAKTSRAKETDKAVNRARGDFGKRNRQCRGLFKRAAANAFN